MRLTRPTMNLSSIASPTTRTCALANAAAIRRALSGASGGSVIVNCREGERDEHQEQHQELGVAEVVLEEPRGEHRGRCRQRRRGKHGFASLAEEPEQ